MSTHVPGTYGSYVPDACELAALQAFAKRHGRAWKAALQLAWYNGQDYYAEGGSYLRGLRNHPHFDLDTYKLPKAAP